MKPDAATAASRVRAEPGDWQELAPGVRARLLGRGAHALSAWVEFAPGARLPASERRLVRECLLLDGDLDLDDRRLGPQDYHLTGIDAPRAQASSEGGALLYLRTCQPGSAFGGVPRSLTVTAAWRGWEPLSAGVRIKPLYWHGTEVSMLARFAPGARLGGPAAEAAGAACLVMEGALCLDGVLLQPGGHRTAPAGTAGGELESPAGCLLFLHGTVAALAAAD